MKGILVLVLESVPCLLGSNAKYGRIRSESDGKERNRETRGRCDQSQPVGVWTQGIGRSPGDKDNDTKERTADENDFSSTQKVVWSQIENYYYDQRGRRSRLSDGQPNMVTKDCTSTSVINRFDKGPRVVYESLLGIDWVRKHYALSNDPERVDRSWSLSPAPTSR